MMKRMLAAALAGAALAAPAARAAAIVDPVTDSLCAGYQETIEGVWLDRRGEEALRFRLASNPDGRGCYAWLNPAEAWQITSPGSALTSVRREGTRRIIGDEERGVVIDLETGAARSTRGGRVTEGRVLK